MSAVDIPVWEAWLTLNHAGIVDIRYDVALGGVEIDDPEIEEELRKQWKYSTAVKIDAVVIRDSDNLVIEVKPTANMGAIGQALGYTLLLEEDPPNDLPLAPMVVTTRASAEVKRVAEALGVRIDIVSVGQT